MRLGSNSSAFIFVSLLMCKVINMEKLQGTTWAQRSALFMLHSAHTHTHTHATWVTEGEMNLVTNVIEARLHGF